MGMPAACPHPLQSRLKPETVRDAGQHQREGSTRGRAAPEGGQHLLTDAWQHLLTDAGQHLLTDAGQHLLTPAACPPLNGALPPLPQTTNVSRAATGGGGVGLSRLGSSAMLDGGDQDRERQRKRRVSAWFQGGCWGRGQASLTQHMRRVGGLGLKWFWGVFRVGRFRPIPLPLLRPPPLPAGSRFRQR